MPSHKVLVAKLVALTKENASLRARLGYATRNRTPRPDALLSECMSAYTKLVDEQRFFPDPPLVPHDMTVPSPVCFTDTAQFLRAFPASRKFKPTRRVVRVHGFAFVVRPGRRIDRNARSLAALPSQRLTYRHLCRKLRAQRVADAKRRSALSVLHRGKPGQQKWAIAELRKPELPVLYTPQPFLAQPLPVLPPYFVSSPDVPASNSYRPDHLHPGDPLHSHWHPDCSGGYPDCPALAPPPGFVDYLFSGPFAGCPRPPASAFGPAPMPLAPFLFPEAGPFPGPVPLRLDDDDGLPVLPPPFDPSLSY